jgi:hypothetical protein
MNELQQKSIDANLDKFCKDLTDIELGGLTNFIVYGCHSKKPHELAIQFIEEFFSTEEWDKNLSDEIEKPQYFNKASRNTQELIRVVRIGLLEKSFHRYLKGLLKQPKVVLTKEDKTSLREILEEHQAMLEYQLEDEDFIHNSVGDESEELVASKRKHLEFLEKFGNLKFL